MGEHDVPSCAGITAVFFATVAVFASVAGNFWCDFALRNVEFSPVGYPNITNTTQIGSGLWNYEAYDTWISTDLDQVYVTTYKYCVPFGEGSLAFDTMWKSAKAFSILSAVVGGIFAFSSCVVLCVRPSKTHFLILSAGYLMTTLFQGLVFLYFSSNGCKGTPSRVEFNGITFDTTWSDCTPSHAANLAITGVVLWFAATVVLLFTAVRFTANEGMGEKSAKTEGEETAGEAATSG